jgi:hypothetical protein
LTSGRQQLGHALNDAFACLKRHFHKVTLLKRLGQEQQSPGGREVVQLGSNRLSTF